MAHAVRALARDRNYLSLWVGQFISIFGDRFTYLALLTVVVARARDPRNPAAELALLPLASFLPAILFGPWIGAIVDRSDTRRVLILSDLARGLAVLAMIPATIYGGLPALFALVFALYVANTFFLPARSAIVPLLVPAAQLTEANSLATFAGVAATIAGSLAGGALIDRFGWRWGFALDAATYFVSVIALWRIRIAAPAPAPRHEAAGDGPAASAASARYRKLAAEIREGFSILLRTPRAWMVTLTVMLLWMAGGVLHVAVPIMVGEGGRVASGVGALIASAAVGMILGTLGIAARGAVASPGKRLSVGLLGAGASISAFALVPNGGAAMAVAFLAGLFVSILLVTAETALQEAIAVEARGRVFALRDMAARLAVLATAGGAGWVVARGLPPRTAVLVAGALLGATGLVGFRARWMESGAASGASRDGDGARGET
ncbi:MAG: MFS transporter [Candidatus Eisenbacteria bacterium]